MIELRIIKEDKLDSFLKECRNSDVNSIKNYVKLAKQTKTLAIIRRAHGAMSKIFLVRPEKYNPELKIMSRLKSKILNYVLEHGKHIILGRDIDIEKIGGSIEENRHSKGDSGESSNNRRICRNDIPVQEVLQEVQPRVKRTYKKRKKRAKKSV